MAEVTRPAKKPGAPAAPKKKSAAGGKKRLPLTPAERAKGASALVTSAVAAMREVTGSLRILCGGKAGDAVFGIPVPLAFQILIQNDILPFGSVTIITGNEGTCKSGLLLEIGRWFTLYDGVLQFVENESKFDPAWGNSIIGWPDELGREVFGLYPSDSVEDSHSYLTTLVRQAKEMMDAKGGPGRIHPVLFGLDSIAGKLAIETQEKMEAAGHGGRSHPLEAMMNTQFLKKLPTDLAEWPFAFAAVNHIKEDMAKSKHGMVVKRKPGGKHNDYQESFEIEMAKDQNSRISLLDDDPEVLEVGGLRLQMKIRKNSNGETGRSLKINVLWKYRRSPVTGLLQQYTVFDWSASLVDFLTQFTGERRAKIATVVDLHQVKGGYWSKRLKVSKEQPLSKSAIGRRIEEDPEIVAQLQTLFAVHIRHKFVPGVDFRKQLAHQVRVVQQKMNV